MKLLSYWLLLHLSLHFYSIYIFFYLLRTRKQQQVKQQVKNQRQSQPSKRVGMKANEQVLIPTPPLFNRNIDHFKSEETNLCWLCSSFTFSLVCRKKPVSPESCTSASTDTPGAEKYFTKGYSYLRSLTKKSCANYNLGCYKASSLKQKVSL